MKKTYLIAGFVIVALLVIGVVIHQLWLPFFTIRRLNAAYKEVERGMTVEEVARIMSYPSRTSKTNLRVFWDDQLFEEVVSPRVEQSVSYRVDTFFLPIIYEFTFDSEGRLVGRHKYD